MSINMTLSDIKKVIVNLSLEDLIELDEEISEKIAESAMMKLAETGFQEWNQPEEDIYNDESA